jgi:putative ABC transport system permease protein
MNKRRKHAPPELANWIISRCVGQNYLEEFLGDLEEIHEERLMTRGRFFASLMYWVDAFHLLIGFSSRIPKHKNNGMMMSSMFKIAWRSALRQKQFTILNVAGLTIGIATCLIIGLYVYDETTYDTFHSNGDRIYRINQPMIWNNWDEQFASTGPNVAEALREDAPEFEQVTRLLSIGEQTVRVRAEKEKTPLFTEEKYFAAEENFFKVFSFKFLSGDPATALKEPMSMVLTLSTSKRYFADEDPIGKVIEVKNKDGSWAAYTIRGVLADVPTRSHLQFDILVSLASFSEMMNAHSWKWIWTAFSTYGLVKEGTNIQALTERIQSIPPKWAAATTERIFNQTYSEYTAGKQWRLYLQPLREIYLARWPEHHRFGPSGNPQFVTIFSGIGILVLALSSINFMNLSTARSSNRTKEVGVRKVLGSERRMLVKQFIVESILYAAVSAVCAFLLVQLCLGAFNAIAEKQLTLISHLTNPFFAGTVVSGVLVLGVIAGSYPAFYLSSFKPIETLKGKVSAGFKRRGIRNGLVVFQFTVSIALIICTFFVQKQLTYTSSMDVGFVRDNVLQIHHIEQLGADAEVLKTKLEANPAFSHVAKSFAIPPYVWDGERYKALGDGHPIADISNIRVDDNYLTLLGVEFLAGRNFDPERVNDKYGIILNEEAVKVLGWGTKDTYAADSPIGKFAVQAFDKEEKLEVIGVVKNFNFNSVKQKIDPLMVIHNQNDLFWNYGQGRSFLSMRLNPESVKNTNDLQSVIGDVKNEIAGMDGSVLFKYSFMDQEFESTFRSEQRMATVLNLFTFLAVIIACLGLFGLAAFSAEQRMKELGIRKVLGAKVHELMLLFSSEFTKLVLLAILLASPLAWFLVDYWLSNFAFRTSIDLWVFVIAAVSALMIALLTISYQSFSAANTNPVETLKNE